MKCKACGCDLEEDEVEFTLCDSCHDEVGRFYDNYYKDPDDDAE